MTPVVIFNTRKIRNIFVGVSYTWFVGGVLDYWYAWTVFFYCTNVWKLWTMFFYNIL